MSALVLHNARLAGTPGRQHLVLVDGHVKAICDDQALRDFLPRVAARPDLAGRVVTAGLTDSHVYPVMGIDVTVGIDLSHCRDLCEVRDALSGAERDHAGWIVGWGLDPNCFGDLPVGNAALRDVLGAAPAVLRMLDAHSALVSDEALRLAGITGAREFASRSRIVCDQFGRPTGLLLEEQAMSAVEAITPAPSFAQRRSQLKAFLDAMAAAGLCGGHVMDAHGDAVRLLQSPDEAGELPLRLQVMPWRRPEDDDRRVAEILDMQGLAGRLWHIAGAKLFIDGTIDNGTAWLNEPDCHGASTTPYWRDPADYTRAVDELARHGSRPPPTRSATPPSPMSSARSTGSGSDSVSLIGVTPTGRLGDRR